MYLGVTAGTPEPAETQLGAKIAEIKTVNEESAIVDMTVRETSSETFSSDGNAIDPNFSLTSNVESQNLTEASVSFNTSFDPLTEKLGIAGQDGNSGSVEGLSWAYDVNTGVLQFTGDAPMSSYESAISQVVYVNENQGDSNGATREFSITVGDAQPFYGPNNSYDEPHYYKVIERSSALSWLEAKNLAEAQTHMGLTGYLATISSAEENAHIAGLLNDNKSWIGAHDAAEDKKWRWVTGPESYADALSGDLFFIQNGVESDTSESGAIGGLASDSKYNN